MVISLVVASDVETASDSTVSTDLHAILAVTASDSTVSTDLHAILAVTASDSTYSQ